MEIETKDKSTQIAERVLAVLSDAAAMGLELDQHHLRGGVLAANTLIEKSLGPVPDKQQKQVVSKR